MIFLQLGKFLIRLFQFFLQLGHRAVAQFCGAVQIAPALSLLLFDLGRFNFFFECANPLDRIFLVLPMGFEPAGSFAQVFNLALQLSQPFPGGFVFFALERLTFDFELENLPLHFVNFDRHAVDLNPQPRRRFVDKINSLVRQETIADITMRQRRGADDRAVGNTHAVVHFVAFFEAAKNCDGVFDGRLADIDLLEPSFQRRVFLDAFTVFVQSRRADAAQLAASQRRLEHVRCIHGAFGGSGADQSVQLVDKKNYLSGGVGDFL